MAAHARVLELRRALYAVLAAAAQCTAPFVLVLDTTIVTVALPSIGRELGFSPATLHWVLASYALVFGGLLLLGGRLGDLFGHRRPFLAGAGLFAAASMVGGLAAAPWMLLAARVVQGMGAAALMPAALALVTASFPDRPERDRALGIYSGVAALDAAAGVVLGGVLTQLLGWRSVLFAAVPIALTAFLLPASVGTAPVPETSGSRSTCRAPPPSRPPSPDCCTPSRTRKQPAGPHR